MATGKNNERKRIECCKGMRDDESWRDYRTLFLHAREADNETFVKGFFCPPTQSTCEITRSIAAFAVNSNRE